MRFTVFMNEILSFLPFTHVSSDDRCRIFFGGSSKAVMKGEKGLNYMLVPVGACNEFIDLFHC